MMILMIFKNASGTPPRVRWRRDNPWPVPYRIYIVRVRAETQNKKIGTLLGFENSGWVKASNFNFILSDILKTWNKINSNYFSINFRYDCNIWMISNCHQSVGCGNYHIPLRICNVAFITRWPFRGYNKMTLEKMLKFSNNTCVFTASYFCSQSILLIEYTLIVCHLF